MAFIPYSASRSKHLLFTDVDGGKSHRLSLQPMDAPQTFRLIELHQFNSSPDRVFFPEFIAFDPL